MRLTRIYTRIGDKGQTAIVSGDMVSKTDPRIEAYGTVDELNSSIGYLRDNLSEKSQFQDLVAQLAQIQNELFDIGGELATPMNMLNVQRQQVVTQQQVTRLENEIDTMNAALPPLENFVLPGGHRLVSLTHMARTVCRRAERCIVGFRSTHDSRVETLVYMNRLSDWLFVLSREIARRLGVAEVLWRQNK